MPSFEHTAEVMLPADKLFAYLADPGNLAQLTEAFSVSGAKVPVEAEGEAWLRADRHAKTLRWGSPDEGDDHGRLSVEERGAGQCEVSIRFHTGREGGQNVRRVLAEAVATLTQRAAAETDREAGEHQQGWT